jgi:hypothetical protein
MSRSKRTSADSAARSSASIRASWALAWAACASIASRLPSGSRWSSVWIPRNVAASGWAMTERRKFSSTRS